MKEWREFEISIDEFKEKFVIPKKCKIQKIKYNEDTDMSIIVKSFFGGKDD